MNHILTPPGGTGRRPASSIRVFLSLFFLALLASAGVRGQETTGEQLMKTGPEVTVTDPMEVTPSGPAPEWAPDIDPQMQAVIEQLMSYEAPGFVKLTAFQVRNAPLPAAAVADLIKKTGMPAAAPKVDISHRLLPVGSDEGTLVRIYKPLDAGDAPLPVIVSYHGGGWVIADLDTYEPSAIAMAEQTRAVVVSVAFTKPRNTIIPRQNWTIGYMGT